MSQVLAHWAGMTGVMLPFAGNTPPAHALMCYGQAVSRSVHSELFKVIGTTYGVGDGSTTFNVPDCRGRTLAGRDNMGGTPAGRLTTAGAGFDGTALGANGGAQTHTLTNGQMPIHSHGVTDPTHGHSVYDPQHTHAVYDPGHAHTYNRVTTSNGQGSDIGTANNHTTGSTTTNTTGISLYSAATGISIYASGTGISIQNQGGGGAHNNTQPTLVANYIIII